MKSKARHYAVPLTSLIDSDVEQKVDEIHSLMIQTGSKIDQVMEKGDEHADMLAKRSGDIVRIVTEISSKIPPVLFSDEEMNLAKPFLLMLRRADIRDTATYLRECATKGGRKKVSQKTGLGEQVLLRIANHNDLIRLSGVDAELAYLLKITGVDSPLELSQRNPENLISALKETLEKNPSLNIEMPKVEKISGVISEARERKLKQIIFHH